MDPGHLAAYRKYFKQRGKDNLKKRTTRATSAVSFSPELYTQTVES